MNPGEYSCVSYVGSSHSHAHTHTHNSNNKLPLNNFDHTAFHHPKYFMFTFLAHTWWNKLLFLSSWSSYLPVVVTPEKTQHWPYDTGVPSEERYFLRISTLLLHAAGETPSE